MRDTGGGQVPVCVPDIFGRCSDRCLSSLSASQDADVFRPIAQMVDRIFGCVGAADNERFVLPTPKYPPDALGDAYPHDLLLAHQHVHEGVVNMLNHMIERVRSGSWCINDRIPRAMVRTLLLWAGEHALHCLFWRLMSPDPPPDIPDNLGEAMDRQYGSTSAAIKLFASLCTSIAHRGWGVLGLRPDGRLVIFHTGELVNIQAWPISPLLVCDMWEHAYEKRYDNDRTGWVNAFLKMVDWKYAAQRYNDISTL